MNMKSKRLAIITTFVVLALFVFYYYNTRRVNHGKVVVSYTQENICAPKKNSACPSKTTPPLKDPCAPRVAKPREAPWSLNPTPPQKKLWAPEPAPVQEDICVQECPEASDPLCYTPEPPVPIEKPADCTVLISTLREIVIHGDCRDTAAKLPLKKTHEKYCKADVGIPNVVFKDIEIPGGKTALRNRLSRFLNREITAKEISEIKLAIVNYFREVNYPIVYVNIPTENIKSNTLRINIYQARLGKLNCIGNRHFSDYQLRKYITVQPGDLINVETLTKNLDFINRNTFRQSDIVFKEGEEQGTTDIDLITKDRKKWRVYVGADNTGLVNTGQQRYYTGINLGNLWNLAHMLTYQFTTGPNAHKFYSHTLNYLAPISSTSLIQLFGGFSRVHGGLNFPNDPGYSTHGQSMQGSLRYDITLPPSRNLLHDLSLGGDWKNTNVQMLFARDVFFKTRVNITQLYCSYNLGIESTYCKFPFVLEGFWSPGQWIEDQENSHFNALRRYAKNHYFYTRAAFSPLFRIPKADFYISLTARGQYSTQNLLSSEQMGIGGYDTVRGYNEQQLNGDSGIITNVEIRSPYIHIMKHLKKKNTQDSLQFLIFSDYGLDIMHKAEPGVPKTDWIASYGAGARYQWETNLSARVDYGQQLHHVTLDNIKHKWHFGVTASF